MAVASLAAHRPDIVRHWKFLGATKLYHLAVIKEGRIKSVLRSQDPDRLMRMSDTAFAALFGQTDRTRREHAHEDGPKVTVARIAALRDRLHLAAARLKSVRDPATRAALCRELRALEVDAARLRHALSATSGAA